MIAPSLLSADFSKLEAEIRSLEEGGADILHLDIMDGRFTPQITFGAFIVKQIRRITRLPLDVHLMIENPQNHIDSFVEAGADILTVHAEAAGHRLHKILTDIRSAKIKAGVALNPPTPLCLLSDVLPYLDTLLIMSVNCGFGGQSFIPEMEDKVRRAREFIKGRDILLEVDGGVNDRTAAGLWRAGAMILVAGNYIFGSADYGKAIKTIHDLKHTI